MRTSVYRAIKPAGILSKTTKALARGLLLSLLLADISSLHKDHRSDLPMKAPARVHRPIMDLLANAGDAERLCRPMYLKV